MTGARAALLFALAGALLAGRLARADGADGGRGAPADADAGAADPDQEIIDHMDELQNLELLQHLELFDPKAEEK